MKSEDKEKLLKSVPALDFKSFSLVFASSWAESKHREKIVRKR